jgi:hypothetical protein
METAVADFNETFAHWDIRLPPEDVAARRAGRIAHAGWMIWYCFGSDDKGEYLDYYAAHRMTNDRHERLYADGSNQFLPTLEGMRPASPHPLEDAALADAQRRRNRDVLALLEEKGFGIAGDEPAFVQVQRYLLTRDDTEE